jgi:serine/threonine-protein kinase
VEIIEEAHAAPRYRGAMGGEGIRTSFWQRKRTAPLSPWGSTPNSEEARAYLQERITLFSKLLLTGFLILVAFVLSLYAIFPHTRPAHADIVHGIAIASLVALGIISYAALHRHRVSIVALYRLDALYAIGVGCAFGVSAFFSSDQPANSFIWHTFMVFGRGIIVPSTGRRTAVVTTCSFLPLLIAGVALAMLAPERLAIPPVAFVLGGILFAVFAVVLATTGSRVIYGLRREVREARQLGQYTLNEKIGEGGMGAVYRAHHAMLRRPTAIKLLPPDKLGTESVRRFEREVQHMSRLTHPNTVAVYDYGRSPDGVFYYAMEYLDGVDLQTLVDRDGPQPSSRVIHILRQVCGALDEAHAMGLIHRDIKPANIILCQRGRQPDVAKVVDFGLVRELSYQGEKTTSRVIAGTPAYMSPEAVTDPDSVGPHSDLYSLGAVGYFLLTGKRVFGGKTAIDVCVQHASADPTPPSQRTPLPIAPELEALVMACLAKHSRDRPASAQALRLALTQLQGHYEWDETLASEWWREFDARRAARGDGELNPSGSATTISVDVNARTVMEDDDVFMTVPGRRRPDVPNTGASR